MALFRPLGRGCGVFCARFFFLPGGGRVLAGVIGRLTAGVAAFKHMQEVVARLAGIREQHTVRGAHQAQGRRAAVDAHIGLAAAGFQFYPTVVGLSGGCVFPFGMLAGFGSGFWRLPGDIRSFRRLLL